MARVIFWDVDTQYDFMHADGKLYVPTVLDVLAPDDIVLYGVATDVCDKAAVEGLLERRPHTRLLVVTDAVKGIDKDVSEQLLRDWGDEGVRLVKTKEVVEEGLVEDLARAGA